MPDDKRVNLDDTGDIGNLNPNDLLKDVMAATQHVKQRKADDKAQDQKLLQKKTDRRLMYVIVGVAAVVLFLIAYLMIFRGEQTQAPIPQNNNSKFALPPPGSRPGTPQSGVMTPAPRPVQPTQPVAPARPTTEPVRPNGGDDYNQNRSGQGDGM